MSAACGKVREEKHLADRERCSASAAINFAFAIFTILMVFVEMVLFCTHRLSPVLNLVMQCIKSAIWTVYLILIIISAASSGGSGGGAVFLILVILYVPQVAPKFARVEANSCPLQPHLHRPPSLRSHPSPPQAQRHAPARQLRCRRPERSLTLRAQPVQSDQLYWRCYHWQPVPRSEPGAAVQSHLYPPGV